MEKEPSGKTTPLLGKTPFGRGREN